MDVQTFLFADLSGFTALTEAHGDYQAAELVTQFDEVVRDLLPVHGGEEIKTIGDAIMVRVPEAEGAVRLGLGIVHALHRRPGFPVVHVGMHTGPAVQQGSDWFGASVNVAARVAGAAGGDEVLLTEATREALDEVEGVELESRGKVRFRNVSQPVHLFRAYLAGARMGNLPIDPVCRMTVALQQRAGYLLHAGAKYSFCSLECVAAFASDPDRFTSRADQAN
jgi:class 3 adenylate cyclase/YHS domain-containing protein